MQTHLKWLPWFSLFLSPFLVILFLFISDQSPSDPLKEINHLFGNWSLYFILINLWIGHLLWFQKKLVLQNKIWKKSISYLVEYRKFIGLSGFSYLILHFLSYLFLEGLEPIAWTQIFEKRYLLFGFTSFLGVFLLAISSLDKIKSKMKKHSWKSFHRSIHFIFILIISHILLIEKIDLNFYALLNGLCLAVSIIRFAEGLREKFSLLKK